VQQLAVINLSRIKSEIFIGSYPQNTVDLDRMKSGPKITAVLNLQTDDDFSALGVNWRKLERGYQDREMVCQRWPITDFSPQDLEQKLENAAILLDQLISVGHRVYVHCTAGVGRAPATVIGYLAWHEDMDIDEAYRFVREQRRCDPYIDAIRTADNNRNQPSSVD
jgi:protein-tyrosine phosphatase